MDNADLSAASLPATSVRAADLSAANLPATERPVAPAGDTVIDAGAAGYRPAHRRQTGGAGDPAVAGPACSAADRAHDRHAAAALGADPGAGDAAAVRLRRGRCRWRQSAHPDPRPGPKLRPSPGCRFPDAGEPGAAAAADPTAPAISRRPAADAVPLRHGRLARSDD